MTGDIQSVSRAGSLRPADRKQKAARPAVGPCLLGCAVVLLTRFSALAAPLPEEVRAAVKQVRTSDGVQPRPPFYLLEQFVPKATGDAEQRQQLAALLAEAVAAADTTPAVRTLLCQHLAKVAGAAEGPLLRTLLAHPASAADARIALGEVVGAPAPAQHESVYLAKAAHAKPATRVAGLSSLAHNYPEKAAPACVKALRDADPAVRATAVQLLGGLDGGVLVRELPALDAPGQALALEVLAQRKVGAAREMAMRLVASPDDAVRQAALRALGAVGDASCVRVLAEAGAEEALAQISAPGVDDALINGIGEGKTEARIALMNAAVARDLPGLTPVLVKSAGDAEPKVREAALKVLGRSGEVSAYPQLAALLGGADSEAVEGAVKSMGRRMTDRTARLAPLLARLDERPVSAQTQGAVLRTLSPLGGEEALAPVQELLTSPEAAVRDAAVRALVAWPDVAAVPLLKNIVEDPTSSVTHRTLAARALDRLAASWTRFSALAYLDCGSESQAVGKEGVRLRVVAGKPWTFAAQPEGTVVFDASEVVIEATGLKPGRAYQLGFTWWDYDGNGREQSVWIGGQQVVEKTALPVGKGKQEPAATLTAEVHTEAVKDGKAVIRFRREAASNALVGEVWLNEAAGKEKAQTEPQQTKERIAPPAVKANAGAPKKALIVTGLEYPGHPWRLTAPALAEILAQDKRLEVSLSEDPRTLAQKTLDAYDVIVLNYQNHESPAPEGALANLKRAVEGGKGLVLFHFACGAFIDWPTKTVAPDFGAIAGRVWNPKLRGHDPRGPFRVHICEASHPITKGLADFDTEDELYTCLDGGAPIQVLATARSKVDQKDYPMAFVLAPGKGRTFHCVLGHDVKALNKSVGALYRRGTAWAAGLE
jgi:HEAT repeat protein/type 1 glutamine amidotransferase